MDPVGPLVVLVLVPKGSPARRAYWSNQPVAFVRFVVAASLGEALARLGGERIDTVLVDGADAGDGGIELVKRLAPLASDRPVMLLTPRATLDEFEGVAAAALESTVRLIADDGPAEIVRALREVVADCRNRERRREQDRFDPVTGLPVRLSFLSDLQTRLQARPQGFGCLICLDVDGLKGLNVLLGKAEMDRVLAKIAERLSGVVDDAERLAVIGGGRFAVWTETPEGVEGALHLTRRILSALARPLRSGEQRLSLSGAAGLAFHPADAHCAETLLVRAEAAMYRAKVAGPQSYRLHQPLVIGSAPAALQRRAALRSDLATDALELVFEPQIDLRVQRPRAARLQLRTRSDGAILGLAGDAFDDLLLPIIRWTLESAGSQMADWLAHDVPLVPLVLDLPLRMLQRSDVVEMMRRRLQSVGCHPAWFEAALHADASEATVGCGTTAAHVQALRDLGLRVTISNFGGDVGSIQALRFLPADAIELAADLVHRQREHAPDGVIARALVDLAHDLGLEVGAAGVDRPVLAREVRDMGCDWASGAWVGSVAPARGFSDWLAGSGNGNSTTHAAAS
ncbi:MAG: EAL domain-containing protein [Pseudomonadota bacterium]